MTLKVVMYCMSTFNEKALTMSSGDFTNEIHFIFP